MTADFPHIRPGIDQARPDVDRFWPDVGEPWCDFGLRLSQNDAPSETLVEQRSLVIHALPASPMAGPEFDHPDSRPKNGSDLEDLQSFRRRVRPRSRFGRSGPDPLDRVGTYTSALRRPLSTGASTAEHPPTPSLGRLPFGRSSIGPAIAEQMCPTSSGCVRMKRPMFIRGILIGCALFRSSMVGPKFDQLEVRANMLGSGRCSIFRVATLAEAPMSGVPTLSGGSRRDLEFWLRGQHRRRKRKMTRIRGLGLGLRAMIRLIELRAGHRRSPSLTCCTGRLGHTRTITHAIGITFPDGASSMVPQPQVCATFWRMLRPRFIFAGRPEHHSVAHTSGSRRRPAKQRSAQASPMMLRGSRS